MINVRRFSVPLAVAALAVLGAACGGGGESAAPAPQGTTPTEAATSPAGDPLVMRDNEFVPSSFTIQAGSEITLQNDGQAPHTFTVEGQTIDQEVQAGETETESIELEPGTYDFVCRFHEAAGMTGTLTVEG
ncbi:MAG TPA: cupredoxin domain-containing protein [Actinomycetota bacterium]|nr:cupredoxin domain-containing protein [Actinomycetota bacterium]